LRRGGFDRWDTCFLLSGPYITHISSAAKNKLRPYRGTAMQVDGSEVVQPLNPGDALIRKYRITDPAPVIDHPPSLDSLEFVAHSDFGSNGIPTFLIEVRNTGNKPVEVLSDQVGPALLGKNQGSAFSPSDGSSIAWITRVDLVRITSGEYRVDRAKYSVSYPKDSERRFLERFTLEPGQSRKTRIGFTLPAGQYQFILGYGGGVHSEKSLASNAIPFDVNDRGRATSILDR
jgi:hypothetical protein